MLIPVVIGSRDVEKFSVYTVASDDPSNETILDLVAEGFIRLTVTSGGETLDSISDPTSLVFQGSVIECVFADLGLPASYTKYPVIIRGYKADDVKPYTLVAPNKYSSIYLDCSY